ncbi:MAG: M56 family metallopeptidase, partial [Candidatus Acidiferrales bacterium]
MNFAGRYEPLTAFLLVWTAKATVLLGLAFIEELVFRRRSAALRHRVWAIAIVGSLALPVVALVIPAWHVLSAPPAVTTNISQMVVVTNVASPPPASVAPARGLDTEMLVGAALLVWLLGTMFIAFRLVAGLARLWRVSAYSKRAPESACAALDELRTSFGVRRKVRLLEAPKAAMMPMTWGIFRPRIMLAADAAEWDGERRRIVLSHELAHVARNDWPLQICAEAMRACFWFHPLAWIAANQMRQESERACDDAVLNSGIGAPEYASQLLALAQTLKGPDWRFSLALAIARPSNLERRFASMLDSSISRSPLSRRGGICATFLGACLLVPLATLTLSAEAPVRVESSVLMPETANMAEPDGQATTAPALLTSENQLTPRTATSRRLSGTEPKPAAISSERQASDAQATAAVQGSGAGAVGSISGTVGDPSGAVVPHATVALKDVATGQQE